MIPFVIDPMSLALLLHYARSEIQVFGIVFFGVGIAIVVTAVLTFLASLDVSH